MWPSSSCLEVFTMVGYALELWSRWALFSLKWLLLSVRVFYTTGKETQTVHNQRQISSWYFSSFYKCSAKVCCLPSAEASLWEYSVKQNLVNLRDSYKPQPNKSTNILRWIQYSNSNTPRGWILYPRLDSLKPRTLSFWAEKKVPSASLEKDPNSEMSSVLKDKPNFHKPRKERT